MESPAAGTSAARSLPRRKPLQLKNSNASLAPAARLPKLKPTQISPLIKGGADKENRPIRVAEIGPLEASLAEELEAIRRRTERLRVERERTERLLRERDRVLEMAMREWERRREEQRRVGLELQRLVRLQELESSCMVSYCFLFNLCLFILLIRDFPLVNTIVWIKNCVDIFLWYLFANF